MIAINQLTKKAYPLYENDELIKAYFPKALMCIQCSNKVFVIERQIKSIKDESLSYMVFEIDGKLYTGHFTTDYEWFKDNKKKSIYTLFDFMEEQE
jgi:hypothetical protein